MQDSEPGGPTAAVQRGRSLIEVQLPVSKLSKESYKERTAVAGQTLTAVGKWWGRKPLVLVRAVLLGLLLPGSDDPAADRDTFLALMTMDDDGLERRWTKRIPANVVHAHATQTERELHFVERHEKTSWADETATEERRRLERLAFLRMGYDERLKYCARPEEIDGPSPASWSRINDHLGTTATSLPELVAELGQRRFGRAARVGDAFCGGGSIPFEAARIGCEAFGSDLSPVAALLTWGALNIVGGGDAAVRRVQQAQGQAFDRVSKQVDEWGIERDERGRIADAFLYCAEVRDPATGWLVPLAPSWVIATKTSVIARLVPDPTSRRFEIEIAEHVSDGELSQAAAEGTARAGVRCPVDRDGKWLAVERRQVTSVDQLRGRSGLRAWDVDQIVPGDLDVYHERLYCVRWVDATTGERWYEAPTAADLRREEQVFELLQERFDAWRRDGIIPRRRIERGAKTDELLRTRGWTQWHQLFNPRQLLINGLLAEAAADQNEFDSKALLLMVGRAAHVNSKLSRWQSGQGGGIGGGKETFYNQALNTLDNYSCRPLATLRSAWKVALASAEVATTGVVELGDARGVGWLADFWITDPGYADAINYEELSEFFLAWYEGRLPALFPDWYTDSKRALAVAGTGLTFRQAMVQAYGRLTSIMPDEGMQVVMFTHQDASVWADLALVLWAAGLQVTAAWTVATETEGSGIKQGNYVQGTVLLVLRKRAGERKGDLSALYPEIQMEVQSQLREMLALDPKEDPNFDDADYQLAAYAAALRVMTSYSSIEEVDLQRELHRESSRGDRSPLVGLIERAVRIASDYLVPDGVDRVVWRRLSPEERLYLKGIEVESHGEYRDGVYQEFARGLGVHEYRSLLASDTANRTRLRTPSEFGGQDLRGEGFPDSLLRQVLFAVYLTGRERDPRIGRAHLRQELLDYWDQRQTAIQLVNYLASKPSRSAEHWLADIAAAELLSGSLQSDSV